MPGYDRTGPTGQGVGTGRGLGRCGIRRPDGAEDLGAPRLMQRARRRRCRRDPATAMGGGRRGAG
ncbi:MAG: DUF5320 domain-containing protein, partial [Desulfatitalea sp.]|nr:DUF5320 domain-containing protein [Desulfatitalea sp.]